MVATYNFGSVYRFNKTQSAIFQFSICPFFLNGLIFLDILFSVLYELKPKDNSSLYLVHL